MGCYGCVKVSSNLETCIGRRLPHWDMRPCQSTSDQGYRAGESTFLNFWAHAEIQSASGRSFRLQRLYSPFAHSGSFRPESARMMARWIIRRSLEEIWKCWCETKRKKLIKNGRQKRPFTPRVVLGKSMQYLAFHVAFHGEKVSKPLDLSY